MRASRRSFFPAALALLFVIPSVQAQTLELRLREEANSAPVAGAIARLLNDKGQALVQALSDEIGRVVLRAPGPGAYRIKIDRIGWSGIVTEPFQLGAGETVRREISMAASRLQLPVLTVEAKSGCDAGAQGGALASMLWEEVQKALTANVLTQRASTIPLHLRKFVREVSLSGEIQRQWVTGSTIMTGVPFKSVPAANLARDGFIQEIGGELDFAAPDAATILADEFVASHCFRALPGAGHLAGLAFEPVRGRRVPDVSGTLWVDRSTSELRFLEYSYTGLVGALRGAELGGRVEFQRLANGSWIVSHWHIRMPHFELKALEHNRLRRQQTMTGYRDGGGRAEVATNQLGVPDRAIVLGRVYDSTVGRGLSGALVGVVGTGDSVLVDHEGRFVLVVAASGDQVVTATHPKLGLLGEATRRSALLSIGDTTEVDFAVPSVPAFMQAFCKNRSGRVGIVGTVRDAQGRPAAGREVIPVRSTVRGNVAIGPAYSETTPTSRRQDTHGIPVLTQTVRKGVVSGSKAARTNQNGVYALCNLPAQGALLVFTVESELVQVEIPVLLEGVSRWVEIREWGSPDTVSVPVKVIPKPTD